MIIILECLSKPTPEIHYNGDKYKAEIYRHLTRMACLKSNELLKMVVCVGGGPGSKMSEWQKIEEEDAWIVGFEGGKKIHVAACLMYW